MARERGTPHLYNVQRKLYDAVPYRSRCAFYPHVYNGILWTFYP